MRVDPWLDAAHAQRMALHLTRHMAESRSQLRLHPLTTRLRGDIGDETVVDTTGAFVVWEPKRVVPTYAVPTSSIRGDLVPATARGDQPEEMPPIGGGPPVLTPAVPFAHHSTPGTPFDVRTESGVVRENAAFRPDDPELDHTVFLDFEAFDRWREEDEDSVGHPRDPFHRVDVRPSTRHVEVRLDGETLASSDRAWVLTETFLPNRYYLPREDVRTDLLGPSSLRTTCAYKGHATHFSVPTLEHGESIAWTYEEPLDDAAKTAGCIAFYNERVDLLLDGELQQRPSTPWNKAGARG